MQDLYDKLRETHIRKQTKRNVLECGNDPLRNYACCTGVRSKVRSLKNNNAVAIGIGDRVMVVSGPFANTTAQVRDLDDINGAALLEREDNAQQVWFFINHLRRVSSNGLSPLIAKF